MGNELSVCMEGGAEANDVKKNGILEAVAEESPETKSRWLRRETIGSPRSSRRLFSSLRNLHFRHHESNGTNTNSDSSSRRASAPPTLPDLPDTAEATNSEHSHHRHRKNPFANFLHALENFLFPPNPLHPRDMIHSPSRNHVRGGVLLDGCPTPEEHYARIRHVTSTVLDLRGAAGLKAAGFEFRHVPCDEHRVVDDDLLDEESDAVDAVGLPLSPLPSTLIQPTVVSSAMSSSRQSSPSTTSSLENEQIVLPLPVSDSHQCLLCCHRLFHGDTKISEHNRKKFIADGDMYDEIARLCQEYAHQVMEEEGDLEWITVEDGGVPSKYHKGPIRALVTCSKDDENDDKPTFLIATGRGKVRAGIFSRQHLITTSLESSTALPFLRQAKERNWKVAIVDPNAHGDRFGYDTFRKSMEHLWDGCRGGGGVYILSHSASGGQLQRYLLDKPAEHLTPIRAIAFTDSTHNVQWAKHAGNDDLLEKLQADECIYFRCANDRRDGNRWYLFAAGDPVDTDSFWKHRFGEIRTYWAGTNEHSLTNWYAYSKIWEHFDQFYKKDSSSSGS